MCCDTSIKTKAERSTSQENPSNLNSKKTEKKQGFTSESKTEFKPVQVPPIAEIFQMREQERHENYLDKIQSKNWNDEEKRKKSEIRDYLKNYKGETS